MTRPQKDHKTIKRDPPETGENEANQLVLCWFTSMPSMPRRKSTLDSGCLQCGQSWCGTYVGLLTSFSPRLQHQLNLRNFMRIILAQRSVDVVQHPGGGRHHKDHQDDGPPQQAGEGVDNVEEGVDGLGDGGHVGDQGVVRGGGVGNQLGKKRLIEGIKQKYSTILLFAYLAARWDDRRQCPPCGCTPWKKLRMGGNNGCWITV